MRKSFLLLTFIFYYSISFSQTAGAKWSRPLGGTRADYGYDIQKTSDGGFLFAGNTWSNNIDVSGNHGDSVDLWVVKLNKLGRIQWQKSFGGTSGEGFGKMICNTDGTTVLVTATYSNNGDVLGYHGGQDLWVIKIDAEGNLLWQRCLGGSSQEEFRYADTTIDHGYIIAGYTVSNDGDVTGNNGGEDIWIVKLSASGNLEWQKTLGGSASDRPRFIMQNSDGNYVMVGSTASSDGDVTAAKGNNDLWVVKLSSSGTIIWQKAYGGTGSDTGFKGVFSNDGSLTILANTFSTDGDVTGRSSASNLDTWVVNVDYNNGSINWQKSIGGAANETPVSLLRDADDMFLVGSYSNSTDADASTNHGSYDVLLTRLTNAGGTAWTKCFGGPSEEMLRDIYNDVSDKSYVFVATTCKGGGDVVGYHQNQTYPVDTSYDAWVVKVKYDGSLEWQRCLGGGTYDYLYSVKKSSGSSYVLAGQTISSDGDIKKNYGGWDAWAVEVGPVNTIKGTIFLDNNLNGSKDLNEPYYSNVIVSSGKSIDSVSSIPYGGLFINEVDTGNYATTVILNEPYYSIIPLSASSNFTTYFNTDSINFALQPIPNKQDLTISIIPTIASRPGFASTYRIFYRNVGTTTISSGEILFKKDNRTTLVSSSPTVSTSNGDTLKWSYSNFAPADTASVFVTLQVATPPTVNVGDTLSYMAIVTPVETDQTPSNDTAVLKQVVVGSIDPNDKTENNGGIISSSFITDGNYLQYTVRFQNTGTADAINVIVRDTLGNRVDLSTLEVVTASHPYSLSIENGNQLIWTFNDIMLPASSVDEPGSHGYIVYRIRPKSDVVVGETIHNTASIYFDYNLPVLTNDATTLVQDNFTPLPVQLISFTGQLNNNSVQLKWKVTDAKSFERFEIERSIDGRIYARIGIRSFINSIDDYTANDNVSTLQSNHIFYRLKLVDVDGKFSYSKIISFNISAQNRFMVYPNPARTEMYVSITSNKNENLQLRITDASGKVISDQQKEIQKGNNVFPVNTSNLRKGNYVLQIISAGETKTSKFLIID
jgi:uncharacterized repeat protein (TIGR01451 family)